MTAKSDNGQGTRFHLAQIRKRLGRSQAEVATLMGTTQSGVSRLERQGDLRVSTLREYVAAVGGQLRLVVNCGDAEFDVGLEHDAEAHNEEGRRDYRVIWQDMASRSFVHVAWLEFTGSEFVFSYTDEARSSERFEPFPAFPQLDGSYRSTELFPFFALRLINAADPTFDAVLDAIGLTRADATPAELLSRSSDSQHDTIQVVPEPTEADDGTITRTFLVSGVRHAETASGGILTSVISKLKSGTKLDLLPETTNPYNPRALQLSFNSTVVGWLPDYLVEEVRSYIAAQRTVAVTVERANGSVAPWHVRLQCRLSVHATA